jgi:hypothetical protein
MVRAAVALLLFSFLTRSVAQRCTPTRQKFVINGTSSAQRFVDAADCTDGQLNVIWQGYVQLDHQIIVGERTSCTISGSASAVIDGVNQIPLIYIRSHASLHIENIQLEGGYVSDYGGAVYLNSSALSASNVSFTRNTAFVVGGAITAAYSSTVALDSCNFTYNSVTALMRRSYDTFGQLIGYTTYAGRWTCRQIMASQASAFVHVLENQFM